MYGLFGVIRFSGVTQADHDILSAPSHYLLHRGPDGSGLIDTPEAVLGMHRLSITDVDHGWQPFWSEDGQIGILGNDEIYNSTELTAQFKDRNKRLTTGSDMEVVPHLLEDRGNEACSLLRGMLTLVILNKSVAFNELVNPCSR